MSINNSLLKSIQTLIDKAINIAPFDKTRQAQIIINNNNGTYTIRLDGILYNNVPSYPNYNNLKVGTIIKVIIPSNQNSQMYIATPERAIDLLDIFYPVGCYFETSNNSFNPNVAWGGTWVLETAGNVHVSAGGKYTIGSSGGEETVKLTTDEIPAHTHGSKTLTGEAKPYGDTGLFSGSGNGTGIFSKGTTKLGNYRLQWQANDGGSYSLKVDATHTHNSVGGSKAHNNMQPYIVVNRWHRTA